MVGFPKLDNSDLGKLAEEVAEKYRDEGCGKTTRDAKTDGEDGWTALGRSARAAYDERGRGGGEDRETADDRLGGVVKKAAAAYGVGGDEKGLGRFARGFVGENEKKRVGGEKVCGGGQESGGVGDEVSGERAGGDGEDGGDGTKGTTTTGSEEKREDEEEMDVEEGGGFRPADVDGETRRCGTTQGGDK